MKQFRQVRIPEGIAPSDWSSFRWQMRHRVESLEELRRYVRLNRDEELAVATLAGRFRFAITPYYATLMDPSNPECPIRRQVVPSGDELRDSLGVPDPLDEVAHSPVENLIRVYPDRVAWCVTDECALYCRFCLRKRLPGRQSSAAQKPRLQAALDWLATASEIRDVLLTGGDPLSLPDSRLEWLLRELRAMPHIEIIRLGTRMPATLPYRVTDEFCRMLERYHPIWLNAHFNHPAELTDAAAEACDRLLQAGVPLGNQSVLLAGVNDDAQVMRELCEGLVQMRVRPYYVYQAQLVEGTAHFRTPIERGVGIFRELRGRTSGFAIPQYVLDTPHGKVPLGLSHERGREGDFFIVETWDGRIWRERNPVDSPQYFEPPSAPTKPTRPMTR